MKFETLLEYREFKSECIKRLVQNDKRTVLVIRANIPGLDKKKAFALKIFNEAVKSIREVFDSQLIEYEDVTSKLEEKILPAEYVSLFYVSCKPETVKLLCIQLEEEHSLGRIFDLDVYDAKGQPLTRTQLNQGTRKCYICDCPAYQCARSKAHALYELEDFLISKANGL